MTRPGAAARPITWLLALAFVAAIQLIATRPRVLWAPVSFETSLDLDLVQGGQTRAIARTLLDAPPPQRPTVVLLGDSRIWFGAFPASVEDEVRRRSGMDVHVENFGVFGALAGDLEAMSRHLERAAPAVVVLTIGGQELAPGDNGRYGHGPLTIFNTGLGAIPEPETAIQRADRWTRTLWPLYRYRELLRGGIDDRLYWRLASGRRVWPTPPERVPSARAFFDYLFAGRADAVERAWNAWRTGPETLPRFIDYVRVAEFGMVTPLGGAPLDPSNPGFAILDRLLARLAAGRWATVVVVVPVNPLLDEDTAGAYHALGFPDAAVAALRPVVARHGVPLVDGRRWLPAGSFFDVTHVIPEVGGLQRPLAEVIVERLRAG